MPTEIYLVKVGMTMTEGVVEEWYIPDGGNVKKGEMLYRLETEKVNLDVDAELDGTVRHLVEAGVTMEPGDVVGYIYEAGEVIPAAAGNAAPSAAAMAVEVVPATSKPLSDIASNIPANITSNSNENAGESVASPAARRLARELNVDLAGAIGTGPGGRITKEDVEALAARPASDVRAATQASAPASAKTTASPRAQAVPADVAHSVPVKGMRKTIATRMAESLRTSAQLTMDMDVCMQDAVRLREQLVAEWRDEGVKITYTDLVVRAVAKALRAHPHMNSQFSDTEIRLMPDVHVGIAVALDEGLVVPVIRNADSLSLKALAIESARLAAAARDRTLGLDDMADGTFTVTALGMFGVDSFTPILNAPQSGILGVNRIYDGLQWEGETPVRRKMMRLSLTWDHRALDGAPAAQFLGAVKELLEAPYRLFV